MTAAPSNKARPRRHEEMKFAYAGPFVTLLSPIRAVKPERGPSGIVLTRQPRYTPQSAESWTIGSRLPAVAGALEALFGREYGSVLDDEGAPVAASTPKRRRRRGSRGGRKPVAS